jgi:hypothetical protein
MKRFRLKEDSSRDEERTDGREVGNAPLGIHGIFAT